MDQSLWERLHPLAVLLPMGLLLAAMIAVFLALTWAAHRKAFAAAAVSILAAGALATAFAAQTGRISAHQLRQNLPQHFQQREIPEIEDILARHTRQAKSAAALYYLSACLSAAILFCWLFWKRLGEGRLWLAANLLLLSMLAAAGYMLTQSADSGIRLSRQLRPLTGRVDAWTEAADELAPPLDQRQ